MNSNKSTDLALISDSSVQTTSSLEALFMTYNQLLHSSGENLTTAGKPYDYDSLFANSHQAIVQALALLNNDSVAVARPAAATATAASTIADDSLFNATKSISRLVEVSDLSRTIMVTIYLLTAVIAFVVNFFALLILFYGRRKSRQLNRFLSNLGFSDIIFAIFNIPFTYITLIYNTWWLPEILCPFTSFVQVLAPTVAFYTLIAIGIGRYYVIVTGQECHFLTKSTKFVICIIWLFAVIVALPNLFVSQIKPVTFENTSYVECTEDWSFVAGTFENQSAGTIYTIIVFVLTFILPVVALTYLYGRIGIIVYKHQLPVGNDNRVTNQNLTQTKIKVVKMLLLLVISFIVCWSPVQIFYLILWVFEDIRRDTGGEDGDSADSTSTSYYSIIYYSMYFIFHWLSCSHTIINPFIYCFFSNNFQKNELIDILCCKVNCNNRRRRSINHCTSIANNNNFNFVHNNNNYNKDITNSNNSICNLKQASPVNQEYWGHRDNLHRAQMRNSPSPPNHQSVITIKDSTNDHNHSRRSSSSSSPNHV